MWRLVTWWATCRSRFDESRRWWSPTISVFFPRTNQFSMAAAAPRVGLNSSGNGEASASRFSVSIALRQMEMASFHHFRISVPPSALSLFRGSTDTHTCTHTRGEDHEIARRGIDLFHRKHHTTSPPLLIDPPPSRHVFLFDRRKSCRPISSRRIEREIKGERKGNRARMWLKGRFLEIGFRMWD